VAILLIFFALFALVLGGVGVGSSSVTDELTPPVVKCSKYSGPPVSAAERRRCGPPPANP